MSKIITALDNLGNFTEDEKSLITSKGRRVTVPEGWASMHQSTPADKVFLILDGEASIRKNREEVAVLSRGELVGELALAQGSLRTATVIASTPLEVLHFTDVAWKELISQLDNLADAVTERALLRN